MSGPRILAGVLSTKDQILRWAVLPLRGRCATSRTPLSPRREKAIPWVPGLPMHSAPGCLPAEPVGCSPTARENIPNLDVGMVALMLDGMRVCRFLSHRWALAEFERCEPGMVPRELVVRHAFGGLMHEFSWGSGATPVAGWLVHLFLVHFTRGMEPQAGALEVLPASGSRSPLRTATPSRWPAWPVLATPRLRRPHLHCPTLRSGVSPAS